MFTDVDAGVGVDYERGLKNLKKICEEIAHKKYRGYEVAEIEIPLNITSIRQTIDFGADSILRGQFAQLLRPCKKTACPGRWPLRAILVLG